VALIKINKMISDPKNSHACIRSGGRVCRLIGRRALWRLGRGIVGRAAGSTDLNHGSLHVAVRAQSVEPMAAVTAPARVSAQHQSLLHFIGEGRWSDEKVLAKVREMVVPEMERQGPIKDRRNFRSVHFCLDALTARSEWRG
jgi:hypothetical protein